MILHPCDIFFSHGDSLLGYLIRRSTRAKNEAPTWANHVGCIVDGGDDFDAVCVEALAHVMRHRLRDQYGKGGTELKVYRPLTLTADQRAGIIHYLESRVGQKYGYSKIFLHTMAWLTGWQWWLRLAVIDSRPICSYLVASAFGSVGLHFGCADRSASPDDMMDFCDANPDKYERVAHYGG